MHVPFPFESTKVMPWKYKIIVLDRELEKAEYEKSLEVISVDVTSITGTSIMTHSGRIYNIYFNVTSQAQTKEATIAVPTKESEVVQFGEVVKFLKMIKKSDYKVVDQLHQTPSKISILPLILNSQADREDLLKVLAQAYVTQDITVSQFDGVVANITACNTLSFNNEELPKDGQNHNCSLHVSIKCKEDYLARVLVDTGSSLNVIPKRALAKLSYQGPEMKPSALVVEMFDGSQRTVIGEVNLPI